MSWDISVQDIPVGAVSIADIPDDFSPKVLGNRNDIIARIKEVCPDADFTDPSWGLIDNSEFSIEVNIRQETVQGFMFHVRGSGEAAKVIDNILRHLNFRGLDCSAGEIFSLEHAEKSFSEWQKYRDQVVQHQVGGKK
jgi:hypothetical protein